MKIFKLILNCVLPTLLVFSIVLNVLLLCGFEFKRDSKELTTFDNQNSITYFEDYPNNECQKHPHKNWIEKDKPITTEPETDDVLEDVLVVYEDNNITVSYVETQQDVSGIVHKFKIENNTTKTLTLLFTDVMINGQKVYISGLTCENLLPNTSIVEDFVLLESEWSQFTSTPNNINFIIKLVNSKSRLDWYESDIIHLTFNT